MHPLRRFLPATAMIPASPLSEVCQSSAKRTMWSWASKKLFKFLASLG